MNSQNGLYPAPLQDHHSVEEIPLEDILEMFVLFYGKNPPPNI